MNFLDRAIGWFSPAAGVRRAHARKVLQRSYQGAENNRLTNHKRPKNQSADQELLGPHGADSLRAWARALVRDNAYAWNVVDTIVSNVIGDGITAQSTFETPEGEDIENANDIRDKAFAEWCECADVNGELTFEEIQVLAMREIVEAGECLIRLIRTPKKEHRGVSRPVPFALEMIEADRLALDHDSYIRTTAGNRVVRGIELDEKGKPLAYWIYKIHPQQSYGFDRTPERVAANEIIHLYRKDRIGQTRGVSWFAPAMSWMRDLGVYVDNELQASAIASCFTAFIKSDSPTGTLLAPDGEDTVDENGNTLDYLEPGIITRIGTNESVDFANPGRPNSASEPWISLMLRGISAGTGTSYEAISKDFSKTSYSSSRTSKLEDRPRIKRWQNYIIWHLCQPVWDEFCNAAAVAGLNGFPTSAELLEDRRRYSSVEWQRPELEWVDVSAEQQSAESSLSSFTDTYQNVLGARGLSFRAVFYQRAKEDALRKKLGLMTEVERTAAMMAKQTESAAPDATTDAPEAAPAGSMMGLSTLQWNRNSKAILKTISQLAEGKLTPTQAEVFLRQVGVPQPEIDLLLQDASDGTIETPLAPESVEEVASA